jgi:hypothetical protein
MTSDQMERLERLSALKDKGALTGAEFDAQKAQILAGTGGGTAPHKAPRPPPTKKGPPAGYQWTPFRVVLGLVAIPSLLLLIFTFVGGGAALIAMRGGKVPDRVTMIPAPHLRVDKAVVDDSCTKLLDYCVRVTCTVTNDGNADGALPVAFNLMATGRPTATAIETAYLKAGAQKTISHDFGEARLSDQGSKGSCGAP